MFSPQVLEAVPLNSRQLGEAPSKLFRLLLKVRGLQSLRRPRDRPCLSVHGKKRHLLHLRGGATGRGRHLPGSTGCCRRRALRGARSLQSQFTGNRPPRSGANHRSSGRGLTPRRRDSGRSHRCPVGGARHWRPDRRLLGDRLRGRNGASGSRGIGGDSTLLLNILGLGPAGCRLRRPLNRKVKLRGQDRGLRLALISGAHGLAWLGLRR